MVQIFKNLLKNLRDFVLGDFRSNKLSDIIVNKILRYSKNKKSIKILDYGSGFQPQVIYFVLTKLKKKQKNIIVKVDCYDFYSKSEMLKLKKIYGSKINFKNLKSIPKDKKYDYCMISDVLHHMNIEKEDLIISTLKQLLKISNILIVKDHFQSGPLSNNIIRFMDFLGNYFNDVEIPKKYYTKTNFDNLLKKIKVNILERNISIKLYPSYLLFMANPDFHFVYLLEKNKISEKKMERWPSG